MIDLATADGFPFKENATWWLGNRRGGAWREYGLTKLMKQRGLPDESPHCSAPLMWK